MNAKEKILLSVITINRNNEAGLKKTIRSVLHAFSNVPDFKCEYIIIDGNSSDGSVEVIKKAVGTKEGKKYISYWTSEPDSGVYNAMNKGLAKVSGKLVNIMNSGDELLPYSLMGLLEIYKKNPTAVLYGAMENIEGDNYNGKIYSPLADCLKSCGLCHQAIFTPFTLHTKYGFYDEHFKICADYDFFAKLYKNNEEFIYIHNLITAYDMSGISATQIELRSRECIEIQKKYGFYYGEKGKIYCIIKKILKILCPYGILYLSRKWKKNCK